MDQTITALKIQQRNPHRVNVYLDGAFAFGLARILAFRLKVGQLITEQEIKTLTQNDTLEKANIHAMNLLSRRNYSSREIFDRLSKKGYGEDIIQQTIYSLETRGLINDRQFASDWIESRVSFKPRSQRAISFELRHKGIAESVIQDALAEIICDQDLALREAIRYSRRLQSLEWQEFNRKLSNHLAQKGFSFDVISSAVKQTWQKTSIDTENYISEEKIWDKTT